MISGNRDNQWGFNTTKGDGIQKFWKKHDPRNKWSEEFKDFLTRGLQEDPSMRMSISDCLVHPWISKGPIASH
jgi:serine/threonine protein kinase